jgi:hypothetical protein
VGTGSSQAPNSAAKRVSNGREQEERCTGHHDPWIRHTMRDEMALRCTCCRRQLAWESAWESALVVVLVVVLVVGAGMFHVAVGMLGPKSRRHDSDGAGVRCPVSGWLPVPSVNCHASTSPPRYSQPALPSAIFRPQVLHHHHHHHQQQQTSPVAVPAQH